MAISLELPAPARRAFDALAGDFARVFGARLTAVVAYAPRRAAVFTTSLTADDLDALSVLTETWHRNGLDTPLVITVDEFSRSLDVFPLEYQAIMTHHAVIAGTPPFAGVRIKDEDLRRACEVQARGHLIHVRERWLDACGHDHDLDRLLVHSAMPLRVLLSHVATLDGHADARLDDFVLAHFSDDAEILLAVLALEHNPDAAHGLGRRMAAYLSACERIWAFVDRWHA